MPLSCWILRAFLWEEDLWQLLFKWGNMRRHSGEPAGVPLYGGIYWGPLSLSWVLHPESVGSKQLQTLIDVPVAFLWLAEAHNQKKNHWFEFSYAT